MDEVITDDDITDNPVLVTFTVIIDEPDAKRRTYLRNAVEGRIQAWLSKGLADIQGVVPTRCTEFTPLDETTNSRRCSRCGCWATHWGKPDMLKGIPLGQFVDGQFLCDQCECIATQDSHKDEK